MASERDQPESQNPSETAFAVGTKVRVKSGVTVPDYSDIPLGGWCGSVSEVDHSTQPALYCVVWDQRTRTLMPAVFRRRSERDDLEIESMWLEGVDLEMDDGRMLPIEQPTAVNTKPLNMNEREDRIRAVFKLTSDDPLPPVSEDNLRVYHQHLTAQLKFPFQAKPLEDTRRDGLVFTVNRLLPLDAGDEDTGIVCEVLLGHAPDVAPLIDIEPLQDAGTRPLKDYTYWFINAPTPDLIPFNRQAWEQAAAQQMPNAPASSPGRLLGQFGLFGGLSGACLGAIIAVVEHALVGMGVGAALLGLLGMLIGRRYGLIIGAVNQSKSAPLMGTIAGLCLGGLLGAIIGTMATAYVGSLAGSIVGWILGGMRTRPGAHPGRVLLSKFIGGFFGAMLGSVIFVVYLDHGHDFERVLVGLLLGGAIGMVGMVVLIFVGALTLGTLRRSRGPGAS